jgi:hypothetical protein
VPFVRGRIIPEIQSAGHTKRILDVLLWGYKWSESQASDLDEIGVLVEYLRSLEPRFCGIRFWVPSTHDATAELLGQLNIGFLNIEVPVATTSAKKLNHQELAVAAQTALTCNADVLIAGNTDWFPYFEDVEDLGIFLTDTKFLKNYCEIFVRGHDIPWAFSSKTWGMTWTAFYHMTEQRSLGPGLKFLYEAHDKLNAEAREVGRSLVNNRLPNICFTRGRLRFYEIQKLTARRQSWKRQTFAFERSYYLNFYYPLIYGGFDHVALLVSQAPKTGHS